MFVVKLKSLIFFCVIFIVSVCVGVFGMTMLKKEAPRIVESAAVSSGDCAVCVPIIMYHGLTEKSENVNTYVIPVSGLEDDLRYLHENGYTAVSIRELIDYVDGTGTLPEKPIVLTFDDGFLNNYAYALPLLEKYDMKCTVSIVGRYSEDASNTDINDENPEYAYLDFATIRKMLECGRYEIVSHSYDLHNLPSTKGNISGRMGASQLTGEDSDTYKAVLIEDTKKNQELLSTNCEIEPIVYTYPYGELSNTSEEVLRDMGFRATLSCMEKNNYITPGSPECLFCLCRYLRDNKRSVQEILERYE